MKLQDISKYFRDGQVSLAKKGLALFAVAYGVMPIDLMPELVLGPIGLLDDVGIIAAVTAYIWRDVKKHAAARLASSNPAR